MAHLLVIAGEHALSPAIRPLVRQTGYQVTLALAHTAGVPALLLALPGSSPAMQELARHVASLAANDRTTALVVGEPGTGKGQLARAMHAMSPRAGGPFITVHCAAPHSRESLNAELFGGEAGPGVFSAAAGGTVVLEDVGELPAHAQARLCDVLDGSRGAEPAEHQTHDARVIATTSRDLVGCVNAGGFREDLYYRLSAMPVSLPPLRARAREDVIALIAVLLEELRRDLPDAPAGLDEDALQLLLRHAWPGNIRELRNALERAMLGARGRECINTVHLPLDIRGGETPGSDARAPRTLADVERLHIERTLQANRSNRTHAARELGISRATLIKKIKEYGLAHSAPTGTHHYA